MAKLGKPSFGRTSSALALFTYMISILGPNFTAAQEVTDDVRILNQSVERLLNPASPAVNVDDFLDVYDGLGSSIEASENALVEVERRIRIAEIRLQDSLSDPFSLPDPSMPIVSFDEQVRQDIFRLQGMRSEIDQLRLQMSSMSLEIDRGRSQAEMIGAANQSSENLEVFLAIVDEFRSVTEQLQPLNEQILGLPEILDCPGPGCPLSF